jgi:hypothetical protein
VLGLHHALQLAVIAAIVGVAVRRAHDLGARAGLGADRVLRAVARDHDRAIDAVAAHGEASILAELARASIVGDDIELEVAIREQQRRLGAGLRALRVLGAASSALGFAGALFDIAWVGQDHGVLDLDPTRIARAGIESAALAMALGIGGSGLALSSLLMLRDRARLLSRDLDRFVRALEA